MRPQQQLSAWSLGMLAVATAFAWLLAVTQWLLPIEDAVQDWLTPAVSQPQASTPVVIVDIDEASLHAIGPWPWPRTLLAELMQRIQRAEPLAQGWDIFLPESAPGDAEILSFTRQHPLVLGQVPVLDPRVQSPPHTGVLVASKRPLPRLLCHQRPVRGHLGVVESVQGPGLEVGHLASTPDPDGRLRRIPAVLCSDSGFHPQFALSVAAALHPQAEPLAAGRELVWPTARFALNSQKELLVPYSRHHADWPSVSAAALLLADEPPTRLKGKVVLVGSSALGVSDTVATPFHPSAPGVSVHAELVHASLEGGWQQDLARDPWLTVGLSLTLGALILGLLQRRFAMAALACVVLFGLLVAVLARVGLDWRVPVIAPSLAGLLLWAGLLVLQWRQGRMEVNRLAAHLRSFLPSALAQQVAEQNPGGQSLGAPGEGLVLALHVEGLDRWTAHVEAKKALGLVQAIASLVDEVAQRYGGALEQRHGEVLLIVFPFDSHSGRIPVEPILKELVAGLRPVLGQNESARCPLGLSVAAEEGHYLLAIAGGGQRRRPVLLGPVVDTVLMLSGMTEDLGCAVVIGPILANGSAAPASLSPLGSFLLSNQPEPKPLFSYALPSELLAQPLEGQ